MPLVEKYVRSAVAALLATSSVAARPKVGGDCVEPVGGVAATTDITQPAQFDTFVAMQIIYICWLAHVFQEATYGK